MLGGLAGLGLGAGSGSPVVLAWFFLAGAAEFATLGAVLGMFGGSPRGVLVSALVGVLCGAMAGGPSRLDLAIFAMLFGGIVASTWRPYFRLPMRLFSAVAASRRRRGASLANARGAEARRSASDGVGMQVAQGRASSPAHPDAHPST